MWIRATQPGSSRGPEYPKKITQNALGIVITLGSEQTLTGRKGGSEICHESKSQLHPPGLESWGTPMIG
jgi:hypothetical protein